MERERLGSRLGFILLSAGCAIGIGNVWKFPYMVGMYGGAFFVLFYLLFLGLMGVPILTIEFAIGRAGQKSHVAVYKELEPKGSKWHFHGYAALAGNYILMMFYSVVCGWMIRYFISTAKGDFVGLNNEGVSNFFGNNLLGNWKLLIVFTFISIIIAAVVCSVGLQKGLEKVTKYMMLALIVIMLFLAVKSIFLKDGLEGLKFYLMPNLDNLLNVGIGKVIVAAMNQAFFTLSLGIGAMAIFGSYLNKDRALLGEAVCVSALDTFVAFTSGLIIFPACAAYNVQPDSGPNLIFVTLPNVFNNMPMGRILGSLFFVFMCFAALSTVLAVYEGIVACTSDLFNWSRKKSCLINCAVLCVLSLPCIFGFNLLSDFHPFGGTSSIMDLEDFAVSNILLPLGSLIYVLFAVSKKGWGWEKFKTEANTGKGLKIRNWMRPYITYILPIIILIIFFVGLYNFFK